MLEIDITVCPTTTKMEGRDKNGRLGQKWKAGTKMEGTKAEKSCAGQVPELMTSKDKSIT